MQPEVSIHLIVYNGEKYIRQCLEYIKKQTYLNITFRIFNNASTDATIQIAKKIYPGVKIIYFEKNHGLGGGFNRSLKYSDSDYIVGLSVDILMDNTFIENSVRAMEKRKNMGALQAKIYRYNFENKEKTNKIDTTGMQIFKSRRIINRGHGEEDNGQYNTAEEIFCYEGAVPFFRREALEDVKMLKNPIDKNYLYEYLDEDFIWYADEVDLGWRMRLLGWSSWYEPSVVAWHDRQTTHKLSGNYREFIKERKEIPALKRMLDLRNQRLTFIKNDFWVNILLNAPWFLKRELFLFIYVLIWERTSLIAYLQILKLLPKMLKKRNLIMKRRVVKARDMRKWFK